MNKGFQVASIILAVATFFLFWFLFLRPKEEMKIKKEGNIIFFGDSLVEGIGAAPGNDIASRLGQAIGEPVLNAGRSGDTTGSALSRLENDVLSKNPRLVIILLGGNDSLQRVPPDEVFRNLSLMIDRIQGRGAGVLLLGVRGGIFGDPLRQVFQKLAKEKKILFTPDILDGVVGNPKLMSDPVHPNDDGYAKIAERIAPVVLDAMR